MQLREGRLWRPREARHTPTQNEPWRCTGDSAQRVLGVAGGGTGRAVGQKAAANHAYEDSVALWV